MSNKECHLCFRCEWRAMYLEHGAGARCECKEAYKSVGSCYAYRPVAPHIVVPEKGEKRAILGPMMISGRVRAKRVAEGSYTAIKTKSGIIPYWIPKDEKKRSKKS